MSAYMWILGSSRWLPVHRHMEGRTEPADQEEEEAPLLPCFSGEQTVGSGGRRAGRAPPRAGADHVRMWRLSSRGCTAIHALKLRCRPAGRPAGRRGHCWPGVNRRERAEQQQQL